MESKLHVYAVSIDRLKRVIGSKDQRILDGLISAYGVFPYGLAVLGKADIIYVLNELVSGHEYQNAEGFQYRYALQLICSFIGKEQPGLDENLTAADICKLDELLSAKSVPLRLHDLIQGGSPCFIARADEKSEEYPRVGMWFSGDIPTALGVLRDADLEAPGLPLATALNRIRNWLESAAAMPGTSLVGFLASTFDQKI